MKLDPENKLSNHSTPEDTIPVTNPSLVATQPKPSHKLGPMLVALLTIILVTAGAYTISYFQSRSNPDPTQVACTLDAKICPDGSSVGRTGPNCEFAPCPSADPTANWQTYTNATYNYTIQFPPTLKTQASPAGSTTSEAPSNATSIFIYNPIDEDSYPNRYLSLEVLNLEPSYDDRWVKSQVNLAGKNAIKLLDSTQTSNFDIYLIPLNDNQGLLEIYSSKTSGEKTLADQILSTFHFTDLSTDTSNWKTYASSQLSISFEYPSNFRVEEDYTSGTGLADEGIFVMVDHTEGKPSRWLKITRSDKSQHWSYDRLDQIFNLKQGQTFTVPEDISIKFTRIEDTQLKSSLWHTYENNNPWEVPAPIRYLITNYNNLYYLITMTYSNQNQIFPDDPEADIDFISTFDQVMSSFQFTN